jgi:hypothetical protein
MPTSFSPGFRTALYYCVAAPIALAVDFLVLYRFDSLKSSIESPILGILGNFLFSVFLILPFVAMTWLGRRVRAGERKHQQGIRDRLAAQATVRTEPSRNSHYAGGYALYLRPLSSIGRVPIVTKVKHNFRRLSPHESKMIHTVAVSMRDLEEVLAEALEPRMRLVARGGEGSIGAGHISVDDVRWKKEEFDRLATGAARILVLPSTDPATTWELELLLSNAELLRKTLLILPPVFEYKGAGREDKLPFLSAGAATVRARTGKPLMSESPREQSAARLDGIASMRQLRITLPQNTENGLVLRIDAKGQVLASTELVQGVSAISFEHIRNAIADIAVEGVPILKPHGSINWNR